MNKYDVEYNRLMRKMERGGSLDAYTFKIDTPTGNPSKLSYIQQVLVRTTKFKEWFGDWERSARLFIDNGFESETGQALFDMIKTRVKKDPKMENLYHLDFLIFPESAYQNVSKAIDIDTLEPRVLYHGTNADEFFEFRTEVTGTSRPYAYFAFNREYSENFSTSDNLIYEVFVRVIRPFPMSLFSRSTDSIRKDIKDMLSQAFLTETGNDLDFERNAKVKRFFDYYDAKFKNIGEMRFWMIMASDIEGVFKDLLEFLNFDSVYYAEEINLLPDLDSTEKRNFTKAYTIFKPNQVKLADGRNTDFFMGSNDIRYDLGGSTMEKEIMLPDTSLKYAHLRNVLKKQGYEVNPMKSEIYEVGGTIKHEKGETNDGKKGGYFEGRSHAEGGIKAFNVSTQTPIEVEGGEVIITKKAVDDDDLKEFEGEMLTNREILSRINQSGGGVAFEDGGEIHSCGCNGRKFAYGGETIEDYEIIRRLQSSYDKKENMKAIKTNYGHNLMRKMKEGGFI